MLRSGKCRMPRHKNTMLRRLRHNAAPDAAYTQHREITTQHHQRSTTQHNAALNSTLNATQRNTTQLPDMPLTLNAT
jgi:hypothetical protein